MKHIINIRDEISFDSILELMPSFKNVDDILEIHFGNAFARPAGVAILSSLFFNYKDKVSIKYDNRDDIQYLQRVNFFKNLDIIISEEFIRHDASSNLLECNKIISDNDPHFIDNKLKTILESHLTDKQNLILGILLTTFEVTDNILEHSTGGAFQETDRKISIPGFITAQYYNSYDNHIEIGISDFGKGIVDTLIQEYNNLSREDVLRKAFTLNTSRYKKIMPSRGNGLAKLKEFVLISKGYIKCRTNEFLIIFDESNPEGYIQKLDYIQGTHFDIKIGCYNNIDTKPIFNADFTDYEEDDFDDFFTN
jgi:hypothetical protein